MFARISKFFRSFSDLTEDELNEAEKRWPGAKQRYADHLAREATKEAARRAEKPRLVSDPSVAGRSLAHDPTHPIAVQMLEELYPSKIRR